MPVFRFHAAVRVAAGKPRPEAAGVQVVAAPKPSNKPDGGGEAHRRKRRKGGREAPAAGDGAGGEARQEIHDEEARERELEGATRRALLPVSLCLSEVDWLTATAGAGSAELVQEPETPCFELVRDIVLHEAATLLVAAKPDAHVIAPTPRPNVKWPKIVRKEASVNKWNKAEKRCVELKFSSVRAELTLSDFRGEYYADNEAMVPFRVSSMVTYKL
ncbi:Hypothetical Protein FCC1311_097062 [Hondaea fermentalgiana]|uniref:Uncharacterized protein n=1 Tax=Hondaea fermentalgiana TaxID=2315210 RepID=A0A2R5GXQ5_9STRA|nr:Hypothetical Protein FCC1311_097062 [Hondaea fermentalgiana]|eukprot:GBG33483.1 Hypothetical Protein FCC1311_097062 [Hondaea fermentalgiana]